MQIDLMEYSSFLICQSYQSCFNSDLNFGIYCSNFAYTKGFVVMVVMLVKTVMSMEEVYHY